MSDETQRPTPTVAVVQPSVTGRPNDLVAGHVANSTFGDRRRRATRGRKAVAPVEAEDKAVKQAEPSRRK